MSVRVDDTREEIALFIRDENHAAKRVFPAIGSADYPTKWDRHHRKLDELLTDYELCKA